MQNDLLVYRAYYNRARFAKVVFKSDFPDYVPGDQIVKRYKMGVLVRLRIIKSYGQEIPVDTLKALQDRQIFPFIISEI